MFQLREVVDNFLYLFFGALDLLALIFISEVLISSWM